MTSFPYKPWFRPFSSASFAESRTAKTCAFGEGETDREEMPRGRKALAFSESNCEHMSVIERWAAYILAGR
jgi:hypothetical protein